MISRLNALIACAAALLTLADTTAFAQAAAASAPVRRAAIYSMTADGREWQKFFQLPQVTAIGSLTASRDGKYLAFDGWFAQEGEGSSNARIFVLSTKRDEFLLLGNGAMPTWGTDNRRLACSFYSGGVGFLTIASQTVETIDRDGWGAQWSPDGRLVAYNKGPELWVYDVEKKEPRQVYNGRGTYSSLMWNAGWSPDSRRVMFVARTSDDARDIASVAVAPGADPDFKKHLTGKKPNTKFAWHPTRPRLLFPMHSPERKVSQLWELNPTNADPPKLVTGQDPAVEVLDPCWSADGETLYCIVRVSE
jgi:hypothetical protein